MKRHLIVFAKEPRPDSAKTRLAPAMTDDQRAAFYTAMLRDVATHAHRTECDGRTLCWSPPHEPVVLRQLFAPMPDAPQSSDDLGLRMKNAMRDAFRASEEPVGVVLIGSDAPLLDDVQLNAAFDSLKTAQVVVAPSVDGGYALIGARSDADAALPTLFENIRWSRSDVFARTLDRIEDVKRADPSFRVGLLPVQFDVDTPDDLPIMHTQIRARELAEQPFPKHTAAFLNDYLRNQ